MPARTFILLLSALLLSAGGRLLQAAPSKEVRKTVALDARGRVFIDTYKGSIRVSTWEKNEVDIQVRIVEDDSLFAQPVDRADVRIDATSTEVRMKSRNDTSWSFFTMNGAAPEFHYTVRMPRTAQLRIKDYRSETEIADLTGDLELQTYRGQARIRNISGGLTLDTYRGDVRVEFAAFTARSRFDTYRGTVEVRLPRSSRFDLHADLGRKADLDSDFGRYVRSTRDRDRPTQGQINGGGPDLRLKSYRGTFRLRAS